jgi:ketosteroid isomerase-like protein
MSHPNEELIRRAYDAFSRGDVANDQHAMGLHVAEAEREGRRLHSLQTVVLHVRDGRITEAWAHHYDQHATDEVWA